MSDTSQPEPGRRRADVSASGGTGRRRPRISRGWLRVIVVAMAVALVACATTIARPSVTDLFRTSSGTTTAKEPPPPAGAPTPPTSITLPAAERTATPEPGRNNIADMRSELSRVTAQAERTARILAAPLPIKVAYFNMLGCYHTDRDEGSWPHPAYHMANCRSRMPRQYAYLRANDISIAGVGEFQGKAFSVFHGLASGYGIYPANRINPGGQNPVVWKSAEWTYVAGEQIFYMYNKRPASSSLVLLEHNETKRRLYVLNTHHTSVPGGVGAGRRAAARGKELARINQLKPTGIPILYMGDFNDIGPSQGHIRGHLSPGFGGMGIDQIWGTSNVSFSGGGYDTGFRRMGLTDHGSGIAIVTANIPGTQPQD